MDNEKLIAIPDIDSALAATSERVSPEEASHLTELLHVSAASHGHSYRQQKYREMKQAESSVEHLQQRKSDQIAKVTAAQGLLATMRLGGWVVGSVFITAFVFCFLCEVVFNRAILPWILGVSPVSVLGVALALAPATAPVVLDRILAVLLHITDPVDALAAASGVTARVRSIARGVFLVLAAAVTLYGIWVLADARGVASAIMNDPKAVGMNQAQQYVVNLSLLLVSLAVTINGALFYIFGVHELKHAWAAAKVRRDVKRLEEGLQQIDTELSQAAPSMESARSRWGQIDEMERAVVDAFVADGKARLAKAMARPEPLKPAHVRVREMLSRRAPLGVVA